MTAPQTYELQGGRIHLLLKVLHKSVNELVFTFFLFLSLPPLFNCYKPELKTYRGRNTSGNERWCTSQTDPTPLPHHLPRATDLRGSVRSLLLFGGDDIFVGSKKHIKQEKQRKKKEERRNKKE